MFAVDADVPHRDCIKRPRVMMGAFTLTGPRSQSPTQGCIDGLGERMEQDMAPEYL
jgi:hypothetical protein